MIILLAGLPGTGKTTLAEQLSARTGGVVLNKDDIRAQVFPGPTTNYTTEQDDLVMKHVLEIAASLIDVHPNLPIFLDGRPFARKYQIDDVLQAAAAMNQPWRILLCICSEESARKRLARDRGHPAANRDFTLYCNLKVVFEEIIEPHAVIDTDQPQEVCLVQALAALGLP